MFVGSYKVPESSKSTGSRADVYNTLHIQFRIDSFAFNANANPRPVHPLSRVSGVGVGGGGGETRARVGTGTGIGTAAWYVCTHQTVPGRIADIILL